MSGLFSEQLLEAPVGGYPDACHQHVAGTRDPGLHEGDQYRCRIDGERDVSLEVPAQRLRERRILLVDREQHAGQDGVGEGRAQQHHAVRRDRQPLEVILAHPAGDERHERQPEQQMQIGPQHRAVHVVHGMEHVVMVVPVNAHEDEAEDICQEHRQHRRERRRIDAVRHLHLEHHDGDDDGDHAVGERLEAAFGHDAAGLSSGRPGAGPSERTYDFSFLRVCSASTPYVYFRYQLTPLCSLVS